MADRFLKRESDASSKQERKKRLQLSYRQCSTKAEVKSPAITISYTNKNGQLLVGSLLIWEHLAEVQSPANIISSLRRPEHEKLVPPGATYEQ